MRPTLTPVTVTAHALGQPTGRQLGTSLNQCTPSSVGRTTTTGAYSQRSVTSLCTTSMYHQHVPPACTTSMYHQHASSDSPHKRVVFNGATSNPTIRLLLYGEGVNTKNMARMRFEPLLFYFSEHLEHVSLNSWVNGWEVFIRGATSR